MTPLPKALPRGRPGVRDVSGTFAVAVLVTVVLTVVDTARVVERSDQRSAGFGRPFDGVEQDLTYLEPPLPYRLRMHSPLEHATTVNVGWVGLDVIAWWLLLMLALVVLRTLVPSWRPGQRPVRALTTSPASQSPSSTRSRASRRPR